MSHNAVLILAVAGSGKTKGIIDDCVKLSPQNKILIITYTTESQRILKERIFKQIGYNHNIEVLGWYTFLMKHIMRPFIRFAYPDQKPPKFKYVDNLVRQNYIHNNRDIRRSYSRKDHRRFIKDGEAFSDLLAELAFYIHKKSKGAWVPRLSYIYDNVFFDEVQDLCSYDLDIIKAIIEFGINLTMVGDIRQTVINTTPIKVKNKKYSSVSIKKFFDQLESDGLLRIIENNITYRCRQEIATFSDNLFDPSFNFSKTISCNNIVTGHDGIYLIKKEHLKEYISTFNPLLLRYSKNSGKDLDFNFKNFRISKGLSVKSVCILPTDPIKQYLQNDCKSKLTDSQSTTLYVAVTRAAQSVAFILDDAKSCSFKYWTPT